MIPQAYITEWSHQAPWPTNEQVEQDLVISRALVQIYSDPWLASRLAFRGGTALHKLWLNPPHRYSEDIDLVQMEIGPLGEHLDHLRASLSFLGNPTVKTKKDGTQMLFHFESEYPPVVPLRLKVEINTREHFAVRGYMPYAFEVASRWFNGSCIITTYTPEELLGTKLRALYQRKKGRDLYDLYTSLSGKQNPDTDMILQCYREYIAFSVDNPPDSETFIRNVENKMSDPDFRGDTTALLRPGINYDPDKAYELIKKELLRKI